MNGLKKITKVTSIIKDGSGDSRLYYCFLFIYKKVKIDQGCDTHSSFADPDPAVHQCGSGSSSFLNTDPADPDPA